MADREASNQANSVVTAEGTETPRVVREPADARSAGDGLIGKAAPPWSLSDWKHSEAMDLKDLRGRVVVVRFWTSPNCPFCKKSLPAMQRLANEFSKEPVTFIGAYHAKPRGSITTMEEPLKTADEWGVTFPLALDREWTTLTRWWLSTGSRRATSASFVIAKDGTIAHVHPGPEFFPSEAASDKQANTDFVAIRAAISRELKR